MYNPSPNHSAKMSPKVIWYNHACHCCRSSARCQSPKACLQSGRTRFSVYAFCKQRLGNTDLQGVSVKRRCRDVRRYGDSCLESKSASGVDNASCKGEARSAASAAPSSRLSRIHIHVVVEPTKCGMLSVSRETHIKVMTVSPNRNANSFG